MYFSTGWLTNNPYKDYTIYYVHSSGYSNYGSVNGSLATRPSLCLKPNVKIKSGDGTIDNPYEFEL